MSKKDINFDKEIKKIQQNIKHTRRFVNGMYIAACLFGGIKISERSNNRNEKLEEKYSRYKKSGIFDEEELDKMKKKAKWNNKLVSIAEGGLFTIGAIAGRTILEDIMTKDLRAKGIIATIGQAVKQVQISLESSKPSIEIESK